LCLNESIVCSLPRGLLVFRDWLIFLKVLKKASPFSLERKEAKVQVRANAAPPALPVLSAFCLVCRFARTGRKKLNRHSRHTPGPPALTFPALFLTDQSLRDSDYLLPGSSFVPKFFSNGSREASGESGQNVVGGVAGRA
jgi:hypothetical protein